MDDRVNAVSTGSEVDRLRECLGRDGPLGSADSTMATARGLWLEFSPNPHDRTSGVGSDHTSATANKG